MNNIVLDFRHNYERGERLESAELVYQYDAGRTVEAYVPETEATFFLHVGFENDPTLAVIDEVTIEQDAEEGGYKITAGIPDSILTRYGTLLIYVVAADGDKIVTTYEGQVPVRNKATAEDYVVPDVEAVSIIERARVAANEAETAAANAATAQAAAEAAAEEAMSGTPEGYAQLVSDVTDLKADISEIDTDVNILKTFHNIADLALADIHNIVQSGAAERFFNYGDQIELNYKEGSTTHVLPWDIVAFGNFELENGDTKPGMVIQSHYAMQAVQFDASEALYVAASALPAGTYHFTIGTNWGTHCVAGKTYQFTTTQEVPAGGQIMVGRNNQYYTWGAPDNDPSLWKVHTFASASATTPIESNLAVSEGSGGTDLGTTTSSVKYGASGINNLWRAGYGYGRWSMSANRQFYNSTADKGEWWEGKNPFDRAPEQLANTPGFMRGFDEEFLNIIKPVKVTTALNTITDSDFGATEDTFDTFFLPSLEQEYIIPQLAGAEGEYWPYWKERLELSSPQNWYADGINANHIRYAYNGKTSAQNCRLRSAYRGSACYTWYVNTTGNASTTNAAYASRGCPACVII